jgi:hypothetical protein
MARRTERQGGVTAMEDSRFKIQDPGLLKSAPERQQLEILYHSAAEPQPNADSSLRSVESQ